MCEQRKNLPIIALKGITILPGMLVHFDVSRRITIKAVEEAMLGNQMVFLVAQIDEDVERPELSDLYTTGTIAMVKQIAKLPGDIIRVLVSGLERGKLESLLETETYLEGNIIKYLENENETITEIENKTRIRAMLDLLEEYSRECNNKIGKTVLKKIFDCTDLAQLIELVANSLPISMKQRQRYLDQDILMERYYTLSEILVEEIEITKIKKEFQMKVKEKVDQNQKEYILREQLKVIREELGETNINDEVEEYLEMITKLNASNIVKDKIKKEVDRYRIISNSSSEAAISRTYIETLLDLPWDKVSEDSKDLKNASKILNEQHYGLNKVKERIMEFLAVRSLTSKGECPILCLVGPPGTGKTSIAKSVATSLNKKYVRICLGGVRDEAEIRGHRRTYIGAMPGRIAAALKNAGVKNPLILLDEIDKVSNDYKGDTSSALLEVLDSEQNNKFIDHYVELPIDLSEALFIATANSLQTIPKPLLDRMEVIEISSYTENEKFHIAKEHLVQKTIVKNGLKEDQIIITDKVLQKIINNYTKEAGVRSLERKLSQICRKVARERLEHKNKKIKITEKNLETYLGKERYSFQEVNEANDVGIVRGLAWTSVGGDTLQIEVNVLPGKGNVELTGQLGDIMKESAKTGVSYIRSVSKKYGIEKDFYETHDIHVHIPEGAVPKDGPSAGITMATAMLSAITHHKVYANIAMTGEITLRGRVLPIGGLKEKILAAKMAKIKTVLVPEKNKKDIEEIETEILDGISIKFVEKMEEVLKYAFV